MQPCLRWANAGREVCICKQAKVASVFLLEQGFRHIQMHVQPDACLFSSDVEWRPIQFQHTSWGPGF